MPKTRYSRFRNPGHLIVLCTLLLVPVLNNVVLAQSAGEEDQQHRFNYCFATQMGSGVYDISGRIIQVYRIPLFHDFRKMDGHRYGLKLNVPITLGFFDFESTDVDDSTLPENIGTVTIVPALEVPVRILPNWYIAPSAGFGVGKDFAGGEMTYIYHIALKSVASFPRRDHKYTLWNEVAYLGHTVPAAPNEDVAVFETGLDVRFPLRYTFRGHDTDIGLFAMNYIYGEPTEYFLSDDLSFEVGTQYEIGFTIGTAKEVKLWRIPVPRLGLSYRFGDGLSVVRFVFGSPF